MNIEAIDFFYLLMPVVTDGGPMSHGACKPMRDVVLGKPLDSPPDIAGMAALSRWSAWIYCGPPTLSPALKWRGKMWIGQQWRRRHF